MHIFCVVKMLVCKLKAFHSLSLLSPLSVDWIPLVRELVSLSVLLLSVALGSSLSLVVIAIAWLRYHPLYGLSILLVAMTPYIASKIWTRSKTHQTKDCKN